MAVRAIWKGIIRFGPIQVPVKLYSGAVDRTIHFRLLHRKDLVPVQQRMVHPLTQETVPPEDIRRGYAADEGIFVMLEESELRALEPEPSRDIQVLRFVPEGAIPDAWYDRPYLLGADGDEGSFAALAEALGSEKREGIVRWVMRKKSYAGAIRAREGNLALITLRGAGEVVPASALPRPTGRRPDPAEIKMAEQLLDLLRGSFEPETYRDTYRERVASLIKAKARGESVELEKPPVRPRPAALAKALRVSVERAKKERASRPSRRRAA